MNDYARVANVIRYLDENHAGQPALSDLAAASGLSESHFHWPRSHFATVADGKASTGFT